MNTSLSDGRRLVNLTFCRLILKLCVLFLSGVVWDDPLFPSKYKLLVVNLHVWKRGMAFSETSNNCCCCCCCCCSGRRLGILKLVLATTSTFSGGLQVEVKGYRMYVAEENRGSRISTTSVSLFVVPSLLVSWKIGRTPWATPCVLIVSGIYQVWGGYAACLPGEMFVHHDCSGPVGRGIVDGASGEGFRGKKWDGSCHLSYLHIVHRETNSVLLLIVINSGSSVYTFMPPIPWSGETFCDNSNN